MPDSTSALINQLTNPPNPFDKFGATIDFASKLKDFQAQKAIADIYGQSIDPTTGLVDPGKFGSLSQQNPAALWNYGKSQKQMGEGMYAQGTGTTAQIEAAQNGLAATAAYMRPLIDQAIQNKPVTAQQVSDALDAIPPGTIPQTSLANMKQRLAQMGPNGDARGFVLGGAFSNNVGQSVIKSVMPQFDTQTSGSQIITRNLMPGSTTPPPSPITTDLTPGQRLEGEQFYRTPVKDGYWDRNGQFKQGSVSQWMNDWNINPNTIRMNPDGSISAPGVTPIMPNFSAPAPTIQPGAPTSGTPPSAQPTAPSRAQPSAAPPAPASGPSATPQPPGPGPKNINQPTPPATTAPQAGGTPAISPSEIKTGMDAYNDATLGMQGSKDRQTTISLALQPLPGAMVGGGTDALRTFRNTLATYSPQFLQRVLGPSYDIEKAATDDALATKYMQQITNATASGFTGGATNEKLQATAAATPNPHMPEMASKEVLQVLNAKEMMGQYAYQQFANTGLPPAQFAKWSANWALTHDPRAFMLPFLDADHRKYLQSSIKGKDRDIFNNTVHELVQNNVIPDPTKKMPTPGAAGTTE